MSFITKNKKEDCSITRYTRITLLTSVFSILLYIAFCIKYMITGVDYTLVCYAFITPVMLGEAWYLHTLYHSERKQWQMMLYVLFGVIGVVGLGIILIALFME